MDLHGVKSFFVRKKILFQLCWMLGFSRIKLNMEDSIIIIIKKEGTQMDKDKYTFQKCQKVEKNEL